MSAKDYPVTFPYGATSPPYGTAALPYHRGDDRAMPTGTPVIINGIQIGLSGNTGLSTGPHLHLGRFVGGKDTNPNKQGFSLKSPVRVTTVAQDTTNGKYVRLTDGDGVQWVYLHLSAQSVSVGQIIGGGNMADKIDTNLSKILQHGILGRNGLAGRSYALDGSTGLPWVGGDLTAQFIMDIFNSPEARDWRDGSGPSTVNGINKQLIDAQAGYEPVGQLYKKK